jgi:hypothetical protein
MCRVCLLKKKPFEAWHIELKEIDLTSKFDAGLLYHILTGMADEIHDLRDVQMRGIYQQIDDIESKLRRMNE